MTRPRYKKYATIEAELLRTRKRVMALSGQDIPKAVKEMYRELYEMPAKPPVSDVSKQEATGARDNQGKQKRGYQDSDPTFEAAFAKGMARKRKNFDRGVFMLTTGLEMHIAEALELLQTDAQKDIDAQKEDDVYRLVDGASPTVGSFTQRQHAKLEAHRRDRQEWLEGQDNWKAAGIE